MPRAAFWRWQRVPLYGLSRFSWVVDSNHFEVERVLPLLKAIHGDERDEFVWGKVYTVATASQSCTVRRTNTTGH
jgi:hypothetical protein